MGQHLGQFISFLGGKIAMLPLRFFIGTHELSSSVGGAAARDCSAEARLSLTPDATLFLLA